ncbi:MAG: tetratricopeptide repeat protein, partial [Thermomonas sp.]
DDKQKAAALYTQAIAMPGAPAAAWREYGFVLQAAGDARGARTALQRYLRGAPDAEDRAFVQRELEKLGGQP